MRGIGKSGPTNEINYNKCLPPLIHDNVLQQGTLTI